MKANTKNGGQVKAPVQSSQVKRPGNDKRVQAVAAQKKELSTEIVDDEVQALMKQAQTSDQKISGAANVSFVSLASQSVQAVDATSELYIKGLKSGEYYIQSRHLILGSNVKVIPLAFIQVYNHYDSLAKPGHQPKFLGTVSKPDGDKLPLAQFMFPSGKKNFSVHRCPDATFLQPAFWVPVYMPDFPEILDAVVTFKSSGNPNAKAWRKANKSRPGAVASHMYTLGWEKLKSDNNPKGWTVPKAEFVCDLIDEDGTYSFEGARDILVKALKMSMSVAEKADTNKLFVPFVTAESSGKSDFVEDDDDLPEDSLDYAGPVDEDSPAEDIQTF
jgi:hypothetical protein